MSIPEQEKNQLHQSLRLNNITRWFLPAGVALMVTSAIIVTLVFFPVAKEEIRYLMSGSTDNLKVETKSEAANEKSKDDKENIIIPVDENFGIVIPKISANAKVIADVDSQNPAVYQRALTQGVAQAKGTALPDEEGNIFIFAHSSADILEANRYNAVFYLLSKLEAGDVIYLFYRGYKYQYKITEKKIVSATDTTYLNNDSPEKQLTLMTCWPPGTTIKRLIVIAKPVK